MNLTARDELGNVIAWLRDGRGCENPACLRAVAEGRKVHLIAAHTDPRAADCDLVLPECHFATVEDALAALEDAWQNAPTANTRHERDSAYAMHRPVKVSLRISLEEK